MESKSRQRDWIAEALARYERPLLRYALRLTGDIEVARDVVQDAFLKLCVAPQQSVERHVQAWLYTVVRNRAFDVHKKDRRMTSLGERNERVDERAGPAEDAARRQLHRIALEVVERLPEQQREVFRLKFEEHLSYRQIAKVTGASLGTVSRLISGALIAVRDALRERGALAKETER